jgi:hypothetical protein
MLWCVVDGERVEIFLRGEMAQQARTLQKNTRIYVTGEITRLDDNRFIMEKGTIRSGPRK